MKLLYPCKGTITGRFNDKRKIIINGKTVVTQHGAVDIAVPIGTSLFSPKSGTVIMADGNAQSKDAGGYELKIRHDDDTITGYAHLNRIIVSLNQRVEASQHIADSGNTGVGTGPHLHYTYRINNVLVDPELYHEMPND